MPKRTPPNLEVVPMPPTAHTLPPPPHLDETGAALWREVTSVFEFDDPASYEVLAQACAARSRAERCRLLIDEQGEMLRLKGGITRANPLLRDELANRAFTVRALSKLGLDLQPLRSGPGRPPGR
jgi:hypothetical protein